MSEDKEIRDEKVRSYSKNSEFETVSEHTDFLFVNGLTDVASLIKPMKGVSVFDCHSPPEQFDAT